MRIALYARVSTSRQAQAQTIEQQLERLRAHLASQGAVVDEHHIFRDAGYSGASLSRPGLDQLRDRAALAEFDQVVVTAPDRLARTCNRCCSVSTCTRMAASSSWWSGP